MPNGAWPEAAALVLAGLEAIIAEKRSAKATLRRAADRRARRLAALPAEAEGAYRGFLERLRAFRLLDPACGSGSFLCLSLPVELRVDGCGGSRSPEAGAARVIGMRPGTSGARFRLQRVRCARHRLRQPVRARGGPRGAMACAGHHGFVASLAVRSRVRPPLRTGAQSRPCGDPPRWRNERPRRPFRCRSRLSRRDGRDDESCPCLMAFPHEQRRDGVAQQRHRGCEQHHILQQEGTKPAQGRSADRGLEHTGRGQE